MIKMGVIIGDRYEVLEKIGTGGMSDVYRAKDEKLSRMVAVKILKQEFSENDNFVQKFRTEAQAAAGLMHPNIVNVYDVGDEKGIYYIVMELVDGITLKRYIEEKNRLTVKEAVSISIQVAMGLEAAHAGGIIHRDIKPQNIIISKDGKVKVTDFGIAKAATSNTITSNVMGSVHYTSPEQARGGYSDAMSDIYSLGITMFEMLTGRVPFNGDTTVAIAIKHIQEPIVSPAQYVPDIPVSVEKIVLKCCQKSPDRRYQTASDLIADLKRSLITPDEDFVLLADLDEERATRVVSEEEERELRENLQQEKRRPQGTTVPPKASSGSRNQTQPPRKKSGASSAQSKKKSRREEEEDTSGIERVTMITAVAIAVLVLAILVFAVGNALGIFSSSGNIAASDEVSTASTANSAATEVTQEAGIEIPGVVGASFAEAKATLEAKGFTVLRENDTSNTAARNTVTGQIPEGGGHAPSGTQISLFVSDGSNASTAVSTPEQTEDPGTTDAAGGEETTGPQMVEVPNVVGQDEQTAAQMLVAAGLRVAYVQDVYHDDAALTGKICRQSPAAGTQAESGSGVNLEKSKGPETVTYYYVGQIEAPTESELYMAGVEVHVRFEIANDQSIMDTKTTTFPLDVEARGLTRGSGTIFLTFTAPETSEQVTITRTVQFTTE
ncbi:MAG: Stk1 family PASTA domain-containing Ser/Thr kinase [Lachnospiraceae bacterium]|nr:Stk1 family PASTA domain-containing Ser/Thr kinase [Lachnospiraceae bacterium]